MHQQQTTKQPVQSLQSLTPKPEISNKQVQNDDNASVYTSESASTSDSMELWSQEIPIWIKGEQRFISGVTEQTSCLEMIEALLIDEGIIKNDSNNNATNTGFKVNEYVITERWKRVEQILDGRTKILKIWREWGEEQPEVKYLCLFCFQERFYALLEYFKRDTIIYDHSQQLYRKINFFECILFVFTYFLPSSFVLLIGWAIKILSSIG